MSQRPQRPPIPDNVRRINAKLQNLKKEFNAQTGMAIGTLSDAMTAILQDIGDEMLGMQTKIDHQEKLIEEQKKELDKFRPKPVPEPEPPLPSTKGTVSEKPKEKTKK